MANSKQKIAAEQALYLYGVSRAGKPRRISSPGIEGSHAVRGLPCGDFICWVSQVDHASFAQAVERNTENLEWLALHGVRHQQVVGEIAAHATIIPARFGTVFSSEMALLENIQSRKTALVKAMARIHDADEWGVKVFAEPKAAAPAGNAPRSGKEYLQQKAAHIRQRPERNEQELQELASALGKIAVDSATTGKVSGAQPHLLWRATFLVPRKQRKKWDAALAKFAQRWNGLQRIEVNGPWPPYSFVSDAESF